MQILFIIACLSALAPITRALRITQPDGSAPVNVSEPFEIAWEHDDDDDKDPDSPWLELFFGARYDDNTHVFDPNITNQTRIDSRAASSWTWYTGPSWFAGLEKNGEPDLYQGSCFIRGRLYEEQSMSSDESRSDATVVDSEDFDLEGSVLKGPAGKLAVSSFGYVAVAAACIAAVGL